MSIAPRLRNPEKCNPQLKKKKKKFIFLFTYLVNVGGVEDPFWVVLKRLQNNKQAILEDYSKGIWFI